MQQLFTNTVLSMEKAKPMTQAQIDHANITNMLTLAMIAMGAISLLMLYIDTKQLEKRLAQDKLEEKDLKNSALKTSPQNMQCLSKYVLFIANQENILCTPAKLQLVMFFAMRKLYETDSSNKQFLTKLYDEPFEVWRSGAIIKSIYEDYKVFSSDPIIESIDDTVNFDKLRVFEPIIKDLLKEDSTTMRKIQVTEPFWINHKDTITNWRGDFTYPLENIIQK